mgnify:CR=1 FL=1
MVGAMTSWCRVAERGQQYIYHLGSLARDRRVSGILNIVADTAMLLAETRFLRLQQERMAFSNPEDDRWAYLATRSGTGYAPRAVISLRISSFSTDVSLSTPTSRRHEPHSERLLHRPVEISGILARCSRA